MNLINVPMGHRVFADQRWGDAAWQHHAVMSLFGDLGGNEEARASGQILFRVEEDRPAADGSIGRVLVQAAVDPEQGDGLRTTDLTDLLASYASGQQVRLLLRANTVRTINRTRDGKVSRHRARVADAQLPGWFVSRLEGVVDVPTSTIVMDGRETQVPDVKHVSGELRRGRAQLITTTFHAVGTIADPDRVRQHVIEGVGRAKAYGCGMLTALPV